MHLQTELNVNVILLDGWMSPDRSVLARALFQAPSRAQDSHLDQFHVQWLFRALNSINKPTCICPRILPTHHPPARTPATAVSSKASLVAPATHFFHEPQTPKKAIPHCQSPTTNPSRLLRLLNFCVASGPPADTSTSPSRICSPPRREPHRKPTCVAPIPGLSKSVSRASCTFPPGRETPLPRSFTPSIQSRPRGRKRARTWASVCQG